jgi:hypothetical protein
LKRAETKEMLICPVIDRIDALCIIQADHGRDWRIEVKTIHEVYGNACFTLGICSARAASEGFLGPRWPKTLDLRPANTNLGRETGGAIPMFTRHNLARIRKTSPLFERGWVFQEELLSKRILYWSSHGIFWSCLTTSISENGSYAHTTDVDAFQPTRFHTTDDPVALWDDMIESYSTREFTVPGDRLAAMEALARLVQDKSGDTYLDGLWEYVLKERIHQLL